MAKILLDVNEQLSFQKDDLLIHDGKRFKTINKDYLLKDNISLSKKVDKLEKEITVLKAVIDYDHGKITEEEYKSICGSRM